MQNKVKKRDNYIGLKEKKLNTIKPQGLSAK